MKLLIVSDLHANWPALEAVLAAAPEVDGFLCLGDLVNYGPHPAKTVEWAHRNIPSGQIVQGNHDHALGRDADPCCAPAFRPLAAAMQRATAGQLTIAQKTYLAHLPTRRSLVLDGAKVRLYHAIPTGPLFGYCPPNASPRRWELEVEAAGRPDVLLVGHTHYQFARRMNGTTILNPGSVGQPLDGDPRAAYALWQDGEVTLRRAGYDIEMVAAALQALAPAEIARPLAAMLRNAGIETEQIVEDR